MTEVSTFAPSTAAIIKEAKCFVEDSSATRAARLVVYALIIIVSLVANALVIFIVCREKRMRNTINFLIVNMCCSDLLITVVYMPRTMTIFVVGYKWFLSGAAGEITCKIVPFLLETATTVSILTVVMISFERFVSVLFPLKTFITSKPARFIIAAMWISAAAFRSPVFAIRLVEEKESLYCTLNLDQEIHKGAATAYYNVIMATLYILPLLLIIVFYSGTVVILQRNKTPRRPLRRNRGSPNLINQKVLKMVMVVVAVFVICWVLYFVVLMLDTIKVPVPCEVRFARLVLAHSNCAIAPCLYFLFSENFRKGFLSVRKTCTSGLARGGNSSEATYYKSDSEKKNSSGCLFGIYSASNKSPNGEESEMVASPTS